MPKTKPAALLAVAAIATVGLSACGGDSRPYDEVPASTPALVPPEDDGGIERFLPQHGRTHGSTHDSPHRPRGAHGG